MVLLIRLIMLLLAACLFTVIFVQGWNAFKWLTRWLSRDPFSESCKIETKTKRSKKNVDKTKQK